MLHYANKKEIVNNDNSKLKLLIAANRLIADHKGWQKLRAQICAQHNAWYTLSYFQNCLYFQNEPSKRLPVQSQQLEQSMKHIHI